MQASPMLRALFLVFSVLLGSYSCTTTQTQQYTSSPLELPPDELLDFDLSISTAKGSLLPAVFTDLSDTVNEKYRHYEEDSLQPSLYGRFSGPSVEIICTMLRQLWVALGVFNVLFRPFGGLGQLVGFLLCYLDRDQPGVSALFTVEFLLDSFRQPNNPTPKELTLLASVVGHLIVALPTILFVLLLSLIAIFISYFSVTLAAMLITMGTRLPYMYNGDWTEAVANVLLQDSVAADASLDFLVSVSSYILQVIMLRVIFVILLFLAPVEHFRSMLWYSLVVLLPHGYALLQLPSDPESGATALRHLTWHGAAKIGCLLGEDILSLSLTLRRFDLVLQRFEQTLHATEPTSKRAAPQQATIAPPPPPSPSPTYSDKEFQEEVRQARQAATLRRKLTPPATAAR